MNYQNPNGYGGPPQGGYGAPPQGGFGAPPGGPAPYAGSYPMQVANPYQAPQFGFQANQYGNYDTPGGDGGMGLKKWVFGGIGGGICMYLLGAILMAALQGSDAAMIGLLPLMLGGFGFLAGMVMYYVWLYKSWQLVPPNARFTEGGTAVTPGSSVGFLFIPLYNIYWTFITHVGLCSALNRVLAAKGSHTRAPAGLAIACCVSFMIPYVGALVACILAIIYIVQVDAAKAEYLRLCAQGNGQPGFPAQGGGYPQQGGYGGY